MDAFTFFNFLYSWYLKDQLDQLGKDVILNLLWLFTFEICAAYRQKFQWCWGKVPWYRYQKVSIKKYFIMSDVLSRENIFYPAIVSLIGALQLGKRNPFLFYNRVFSCTEIFRDFQPRLTLQTLQTFTRLTRW